MNIAKIVLERIDDSLAAYSFLKLKLDGMRSMLGVRNELHCIPCEQ